MVVLGIGVAWVVALSMLVRLLGLNQDERESRPEPPAATPLNPAVHPETRPTSSTQPEPGTIDRAS